MSMPRSIHVLTAAVLMTSLAPTALFADEKVAASQPKPRVSSTLVNGAWDSNWNTVQLSLDGSRVTGTYVCCGGGTIDGDLRGTTITYRWHEPNGAGSGRGVWRLRDGAWVGTWGFADSADNGGEWILTRPRGDAELAQ